MKSAIISAITLVVLPCASARALTGNATMCVFFDDDRQETSSAAGSLHTDHSAGGQNDPIVGARAIILGGGGGSVGEGTLGTNGCATITYNDFFALGYPTSGWSFRVEMRDVDDFRVTDESDALFVYDSAVTFNGSGETHNFGIPTNNDEPAFVYATAEEFWTRIVETSANLRARMTNVRVSATVPNDTLCPPNSSCALDRNHVAILDGRGLTRPLSSVAHELGHTVVMHGFNIADINVPAGCNQIHTYTGTHNCDAVPWNEGFGDFWGVVWGWSKNATAPGFGTISSSVEDPITACDSATNSPWRVEGCVTAALWDMFDDPSGDDDPIDDSVTNVAAFTFADTLNAYCSGTANRCDEESGSNGRNHWDFLFNWNARFSGDLVTEIRAIYATLNMDDGGEEPF